MPLHVSPDRQTGKPSEPGVHIVAFKDTPQKEELAYWDGFNWGHGGVDVLAALQGLRVGQRLPFYKRHWWVRPAYWRAVTIDREAVVDALVAALGGGR